MLHKYLYYMRMLWTKYLEEKINALNRIIFAQKSERYITEELIQPNGTLFNEPEKIIAEGVPQDVNYAQERRNSANVNCQTMRVGLSKSVFRNRFQTAQSSIIQEVLL